MIHFNDPDFNDERRNAEPLSREEENEVIDYINSLISKADDETEEKNKLLQRFIYRYENMSGLVAENKLDN